MLTFAYNPTSWGDDGPIAGGMADVLIRPILPHLETDHQLTDRPQPGDVVNVYYTHRQTYPGSHPREPGRASVFVSHGIADKAWRDARRMLGFFDWAITSGPAWTDRLLAGGFPSSKIIQAGYCKLDPIHQGAIESPWPDRDGRIRVLWAPTHGGGGEAFRWATSPPPRAGAKRTTHWHRDTVLELLPPSEFNVIEAPHPRHRPDGQATLAEYVGADVVIADGGSTIYEAWALDLPVVFPTWLVGTGNAKGRATFEADIYRCNFGRHAHQPEQLVPLVHDAALHGITDPERLFVEPILPARYRGISGRLHAEALDDVAARARAPRHSNPGRTLTFAHRAGRTITVPATSPRAQRYSRSNVWRLVDAP